MGYLNNRRYDRYNDISPAGFNRDWYDRGFNNEVSPEFYDYYMGESYNRCNRYDDVAGERFDRPRRRRRRCDICSILFGCNRRRY